jgi:hypothetical protein
MLLYDNIDEYLETRDLITMRISQLKRMEQRQGNDDICISGRQSRILPTVQNNTKSHSYYFALKKKEEFLESELKKVKKELKTIKKNSLL